MFSYKDQAELNHHGINGLWFPKYAELFSVFRVEGSGGLKDNLRAYYATEDYGREELDQLASQSLSEKEWLAYLRMNPGAEVPNYDKAYLDLVQKLASQAFLALQERGSLEDIKLIEGKLPAIAEEQYDQLVAEARAVPERKLSPAEVKANQDAQLKDFARKYANERVDNLPPKGGVVTLAGETMPWPVFQSRLEEASAAGYIR